MNNEFYKKIGNQISCLRNRCSLTQDTVAKFLNISRSSLSQIENGNRAISLEEATKFAELFRISVEDLLNDKIPVDKPFTFEDVLLLIDQNAWFRYKNESRLFKVTAVDVIGETFLYLGYKNWVYLSYFITRIEYTFDRKTYYTMDGSDEN